MTWQNGIDEAIMRLSAHVPGGVLPRIPRFDARDREALAFVLAELERLRVENKQLHAQLCISLEGHD